jgi:alpha-L-fucosidase
LINGNFFAAIGKEVLMIVAFKTIAARYIKFRALNNTEDDNNIGYAEIDVISNTHVDNEKR